MSRYISQITEWHLELTNRCVLECSKCPRTYFLKDRKKTDLSLTSLQNFFETAAKDHPLSFTLCGNHGDPIFHPKFHSIITFLKSLGAEVRLITSGSHLGESFWQKTLSILDQRDRIQFSVDGLENTNAIYRKNSRWKTIVKAIQLASPKVQVEWRYIVFKHNEHQIEQAQQFATQLGVDKFRVIKSGRYSNDEDPLMPSRPWVAKSYYQKKMKAQTSEVQKTSMAIDPSCAHGVNHYISAEGIYSPCCYMGLLPSRDKNIFYRYSDQFDIAKVQYSELLQNPLFQKLQSSWEDYDNTSPVCKTNCGKPCKEKKSKDWDHPNIEVTDSHLPRLDLT